MQEKKVSHEEIARAAYLLWEKEGRPQGRDKEHWRRAEAVLRRKLAARPVSAPGKRRKPSRKKSDAPHSSEERESSSKAGAAKSGFQRRAASKKSRRKTSRAFAQKGKRKPPRSGRSRKSSSV